MQKATKGAIILLITISQFVFLTHSNSTEIFRSNKMRGNFSQEVSINNLALRTNRYLFEIIRDDFFDSTGEILVINMATNQEFSYSFELYKNSWESNTHDGCVFELPDGEYIVYVSILDQSRGSLFELSIVNLGFFADSNGNSREEVFDRESNTIIISGIASIVLIIIGWWIMCANGAPKYNNCNHCGAPKILLKKKCVICDKPYLNP
jgi:hypothetical protein